MKTFKPVLTIFIMLFFMTGSTLTTWAAKTKRQPGPGPGDTPRAVVTKPDLTIREMKISPSNPTTLDTILFKAKVKNISKVSAAASKGGIKIGGESKPKLYPHGMLGPGKSAQISRSMRITRPGKYIVTFIADAGNDIAESKEANNIVKIKFTVRPLKSDLTLRNPKINPANPTVNDTIYLVADLVNIGQVPSQAIRCGVKVGGESTPPNPGYYGSIPVYSPQAQKFAVARSIKITKPGKYIATFIADVNDDADELNESNNTIKLYFTVK